MITVRSGFGNGIITGVTLSALDGAIDEITFMVSCDSALSQVAHTIHRNQNTKSVQVTHLTNDIQIAQTFSIIFQADTAQEIQIKDGAYFVLKDVTVELIP